MEMRTPKHTSHQSRTLDSNLHCISKATSLFCDVASWFPFVVCCCPSSIVQSGLQKCNHGTHWLLSFYNLACYYPFLFYLSAFICRYLFIEHHDSIMIPDIHWLHRNTGSRCDDGFRDWFKGYLRSWSCLTKFTRGWKQDHFVDPSILHFVAQ